MIYVFITVGIILLCILPGMIIQINEYERGIKFSRGKFKKIMNPGWHIVVPIFQSYKKVDVRTKAVDVPAQEAITKDNVSIKINAVLYYKVGSVTLDELLVDREKISTEICKIIDELSDPWGIKVENVELKDIALPEEMQRVIAKVAEAEREKQAVITKAQGEVEASENLTRAANNMAKVPGALHLRTLSTINDVSSDQSNTIIFAMPIEVLRAFEAIGDRGLPRPPMPPMPPKHEEVKKEDE